MYNIDYMCMYVYIYIHIMYVTSYMISCMSHHTYPMHHKSSIFYTLHSMKLYGHEKKEKKTKH